FDATVCRAVTRLAVISGATVRVAVVLLAVIAGAIVFFVVIRLVEVFVATIRAIESARDRAEHAADQSARYAQEARFVIGAAAVTVFVIVGPLDFIRRGDHLGLARKPKRGVAPKRRPNGAIA